MCIFSCFIFSCGHTCFGRRVTPCHAQLDRERRHQQAVIRHSSQPGDELLTPLPRPTCDARATHPFRSASLNRVCPSCLRAQTSQLETSLQHLRDELRAAHARLRSTAARRADRRSKVQAEEDAAAQRLARRLHALRLDAWLAGDALFDAPLESLYADHGLEAVLSGDVGVVSGDDAPRRGMIHPAIVPESQRTAPKHDGGAASMMLDDVMDSDGSLCAGALDADDEASWSVTDSEASWEEMDFCADTTDCWDEPDPEREESDDETSDGGEGDLDDEPLTRDSGVSLDRRMAKAMAAHLMGARACAAYEICDPDLEQLCGQAVDGVRNEGLCQLTKSFIAAFGARALVLLLRTLRNEQRATASPARGERSADDSVEHLSMRGGQTGRREPSDVATLLRPPFPPPTAPPGASLPVAGWRPEGLSRSWSQVMSPSAGGGSDDAMVADDEQPQRAG